MSTLEKNPNLFYKKHPHFYWYDFPFLFSRLLPYLASCWDRPFFSSALNNRDRGRAGSRSRPPTPICFSIRKTRGGGGGGGGGRLCGCLGNWRRWWGILRRNRLSYKRRHGCCIERDKNTIFSRSIGLEKARRLMKSKGSTTIVHAWFGIFCSPVAPSSLLCAVVWDDLICQCDDMEGESRADNREEIGKGCKKELDLVPTWKSKDCKQRGR